MKTSRFSLTPLVAALAFAGCTTMPEVNSQLAQARSDYSAAQANPHVVSLAGGELKTAGESLDRANQASDKHEDAAVVNRLAYLADQQVALAQETARRRYAEFSVANASTEHDRALLDAETREADNAERSAETAQRSAEIAQRESEASQRSAEASQLQSAVQQQIQLQRLVASDAQSGAEAARLETNEAQARSRRLEERLGDLEAKKTNRGMVITLGDVLFDANRSEMKAGGMRSTQKLADFLRQYTHRTVMIEGYTDSRGDNDRNQALSQQRAASVRTALLEMGVGSERIAAHGYGESYPVAANNTAAGRQENRRVEIIVSDDSGRILAR